MKIGLNVGYSHTKAVGNTSREIRTANFPSIVGGADETHWTPGITGVGDGIRLLQPEAVLLGQDAVEQSRFIRRREDREWTGSREWLLLALGAISELTEQSTNVDIITGLPIAYFEDKQIVIDVLTGPHHLQREGRRAQNIAIDNVTVLPETYGTLFDLLWDDHGQVQDPDIATGRYGVIDCGGKTTNLLTVNRIKEIGMASTSAPIGMWDAVRAMKQILGGRFPGLELRDHDIAEIITSGIVRYKGESIDQSDAIFAITRAIATQIAAQAGQIWGGMANLDAILITGGGALTFGPFLQEMIDITKVTIVDDPVMANARGFWKYAGYLDGRA